MKVKLEQAGEQAAIMINGDIPDRFDTPRERERSEDAP